MGRDIEALLADDIEGVVFGRGFHNSKGCRLEHAAAEIYGKRIVGRSGRPRSATNFVAKGHCGACRATVTV